MSKGHSLHLQYIIGIDLQYTYIYIYTYNRIEHLLISLPRCSSPPPPKPGEEHRFSARPKCQVACQLNATDKHGKPKTCWSPRCVILSLSLTHTEAYPFNLPIQHPPWPPPRHFCCTGPFGRPVRVLARTARADPPDPSDVRPHPKASPAVAGSPPRGTGAGRGRSGRGRGRGFVR